MFYKKYNIGSINQYNHKVILIIDTYDKKIGLKSFKKRFLDNLINRLEHLKNAE